MSKKGSKHVRPRVLVLGGGITAQIQYAGGEQVSMGYTDKRAVEAASHDNIHAVILTGGVDISPRLYGETPGYHTQTPNRQRDEVEVRVLHAAFKRGIPVLGICRGSQIINAAFGGTLHQHINDLPNTHKYHLGFDHRVDIIKSSRLYGATKRNEMWVTSIHHQAVNKVAPGFRVAARARDGIIEAIELVKGPWIVGVQFHPEIATKPEHQLIFNRLVLEAARKAGFPTPKIGHRPAPKHTVPKYQVFEKPEPKVRWEDRPRPTLHLPEPRLVSWSCFRCGLRFDDRVDHIDHMFILHGVNLLDQMSDSEIERLVAEKEHEWEAEKAKVQQAKKQRKPRPEGGTLMPEARKRQEARRRKKEGRK